MVGRTFWNEHNIDSISEYCINDVVTICQLLLRYKGLPIIADTNVDVIPPYITDDDEK